MTGGDPDETLASRIAARDRQALHELLKRYGGQITAILWRGINGRGSVDDLRGLFRQVGREVWKKTPQYLNDSRSLQYRVWLTELVNEVADRYLGEGG